MKRNVLTLVPIAWMLATNTAWAGDKTITGDLTMVTAKTVVINGVVYRFDDQSEQRSVHDASQCIVEGKTMGCEDIVVAGERTPARITLNRQGKVSRLEILPAK